MSDRGLNQKLRAPALDSEGAATLFCVSNLEPALFAIVGQHSCLGKSLVQKPWRKLLWKQMKRLWARCGRPTAQSRTQSRSTVLSERGSSLTSCCAGQYLSRTSHLMSILFRIGDTAFVPQTKSHIVPSLNRNQVEIEIKTLIEDRRRLKCSHWKGTIF